MKKSLNSLIAGPGAIGSLTCLQAQKLGTVTVLQHRKSIKLAHFVTQNASNTALTWQPHKATDSPPDLIWICTKSFNALSAAKTLITQHPKAVIIAMHNGMGPQEAIANEAPNRTLWATTTCGAYSHKPQHYLQTPGGNTLIGCPPNTPNNAPSQKALTAITTVKSALNVQHCDNIYNALWHKLMINAVINPITAVHQIENGQLFQPQYSQYVTQLCNEIIAISSARLTQSEPPLIERVLAVAKATQNNRSSMAEDIRKKNRTEADSILGYLIRHAIEQQLPHATLKNWLQKIEAKQAVNL